ncbi:MAG: hypothetical protein M0C28_05730 [Candidatus Moduliflexus flocculans]|nr:hypothetical protein [Candidatus Moduliflexus flocculans]
MTRHPSRTLDPLEAAQLAGEEARLVEAPLAPAGRVEGDGDEAVGPRPEPGVGAQAGLGVPGQRAGRAARSAGT